MKKLVNILFLISSFVSLSPIASAQVGGLRGTPGERVTPLTISVRNLPRVTRPYEGPVREIPEGEVPGGRAAFEEWKKTQPPVRVTRDVTIDPSAALTPFPLAPALGLNFEGITQQGYIPGEPQPAVGPNHVLVIGNVSVVVVDKYPDSVSNRTEVLQEDFFGIPASEAPGFDAKCFYDALRGRFVVLTEVQRGPPQKLNYYYLAISKTSNARGDWWIYKLDMTKDGATQTDNWSDFPGLGVSEDKIVLSGQQYKFGGNQYQYQKLRVIGRALAYSGGPVSYVDFVNFAPPPGGSTTDIFATKPGRNVSRDSTIHLFTTRFNGGSTVTYRKITGPPAAPVLSAGTLVSVNSYGAPVDARQLGTTNRLDGGDCRTPDFFVRNGVLSIAWHFGNDFGSGTVDAIRYLRLRTSDMAVLMDETFGADGIYYYYPMVCVDSVGTMFMGFCRSSSSEYSSSWVTGKRRSDATIQASTLARAGVIGYTYTPARWGDFTGIDMDESTTTSSGALAWYSGLWAKGANAFGTWANQLKFTYGTISGQIMADADGDSATTADRMPLSGWTVTLKQGASTVASTNSNASGIYSFGYLESETYDLILTLQGGYYASSSIPGSGGSSQTRISNDSLHVVLTNVQSSTGNIFLVSLRSIASVRVYLQGPYSSGSMTTLVNSILPLTSPYSSAPRTVSAIPGASIVDWINIELRKTATATAVASKSFFLRNDGYVVDSTNTDAKLEFEVAPGSYYILVRHRNHLALESATAVTLTASSPVSPYDFTTSLSQAYGTNPMIQVGFSFAMISGDPDGSGIINASDRGLAWNQRGVEGYQSSDVDLNGICNASDRGIIWNNRGRESQLP